MSTAPIETELRRFLNSNPYETSVNTIMGVKLASSWAAAEAPAVVVINLVFTDMLLTFRLSVAVFLQV